MNLGRHKLLRMARCHLGMVALVFAEQACVSAIQPRLGASQKNAEAG